LTFSGITTICEGDSTLLTVSGNIPQSQFVWEGNVPGNQYMVAPSGNTYVYVTGSFQNCPQVTDSILVTVNAVPTVTAPADVQICKGEQFNAAVYPNPAESTVYWDSTGSVTGTSVTLTAVEKYLGCISEVDSFYVDVLASCSIEVPNTAPEVVEQAKSLIDSWKKITVLCKDTPGFIVNRVARPFYGEALRIYEEGIADFATIDWAMTELGGFRMGPFTLMDYIGNDINYTVTESVFTAFYFDPRYKPSFTQKRHFEAGYLGRKSGRGYYNYAEGAVQPEPVKDPVTGQQIVDRILVMLFNEAIDALFLNIASAKDIDLAMTNGIHGKPFLSVNQFVFLNDLYIKVNI
ncbi:3-hydroxyacyl-CoA dehydrogenase protein, partial [Ancylostoma ceylanicum]